MSTSKWISIKQIPNLVSLCRILGTCGLLWVKPLSGAFFLLYFLCGLSDLLDGYLARRFNAVSSFGQTLDSVSDFLFIGVLLYVLIPVLSLPLWALYWTLLIAVIRLGAISVGFFKFKTLAFLHTYGNKLTGLMLFFLPLLYTWLGLETSFVLVGALATASAVEELFIMSGTKVLERDIRYFGDNGK